MSTNRPLAAPVPLDYKTYTILSDWPWIAAATVYLLICYVLPPPAPIDEGFDQSYQALFAGLFLRGAQFGTEANYTWGPWGFLLEPRGDPAIFGWAVFGRTILAVATIYGALGVAVRCIPSAFWRAVWFLSFMQLAEPVFALPLLLFSLAAEPERRYGYWRYALLTLACGLVACVKFTALVLVALLVLFLLLDGFVRRAHSALIAVGLVGSFLLFYVAAGQRLSTLPDFLVGGAYLAAGYSAAMGTPGSMGELAVGFLICTIVPLSYLVSLMLRGQYRIAAFSMWLLVYFLLGFKQAFVRSDESHLFSGLVDMILPACLVIVAMQAVSMFPLDSGPGREWFPRIATWSGVGLWLTLFLTAAGMLLALRQLSASYRIPVAMDRVRRLPLSFSPERRRATYQDEVRKLQLKYGLPKLDGTVVLFGYRLFLLPVWNLSARTFPSVQTPTAYNPYLTMQDARYLTGNTAPDHVIFGIEPIDLRFPAVEDSLAWLSLLTNYEPAGFINEYLHLRRSSHPNSIVKEKILEKHLRFGETLSLPETALWAEIDVRFSAIGRLAGMLLKAPAIKMEVNQGDAQRNYRILPGTAGAGFLLSPVIEKPASFELLYGRKIEQQTYAKQVSFKVSPAAAERLVEPELGVRIYRLALPNAQ